MLTNKIVNQHQFGINTAWYLCNLWEIKEITFVIICVICGQKNFRVFFAKVQDLQFRERHNLP